MEQNITLVEHDRTSIDTAMNPESTDFERKDGAIDEETEDEEVKLNCVGGLRRYAESDDWDSGEEDEEEQEEEEP